MSVWLSDWLSDSLFVCQSVCRHACLSAYLFACRCLSVCLTRSPRTFIRASHRNIKSYFTSWKSFASSSKFRLQWLLICSTSELFVSTQLNSYVFHLRAWNFLILQAFEQYNSSTDPIGKCKTWFSCKTFITKHRILFTY